MKLGVMLLFLIIIFSDQVQALNWPAEFESAPMVDFPISINRSSWKDIIVDLSGGKEVVEKIFELSGDKYFGRGYLYWDRGRRAYTSEYLDVGEYVNVGKLPCYRGVGCYLVDVPKMVFLVMVKDSKIIDAKLVYASHSHRDKNEGYAGSGTLDSIFGDGFFWQPLPVTRFEETGIFCSSFVDDMDGSYKRFKRRVNPEGFIETKELLHEDELCEAPW